MGFLIRQNLKRDGQQGVACQHRRHFVKGDMGGGATAPQIIVIHAGQIVMHQRIGVQHFDGRAGAQGVAVIHPEQAGGMQHQERPQPLAAGEGGIAHGFLNAALGAMGAWQHRFEGCIHRLGAGRDGAGQVGRGWAAGLFLVHGHVQLPHYLPADIRSLWLDWSPKSTPNSAPGPCCAPIWYRRGLEATVFPAESAGPRQLWQISHMEPMCDLALPVEGLNGVSRC